MFEVSLNVKIHQKPEVKNFYETSAFFYIGGGNKGEFAIKIYYNL